MLFLPLVEMSETQSADMRKKLAPYIGARGHSCFQCGMETVPCASHDLGYFLPQQIKQQKVVLLCPLCKAGLHIHVHLGFRTITLIAAPWITQSTLNSMMYLILGCAIDKESLYYNDANSVYDLLFVLQKDVARMFPFFPGNETTLESNLILFIDTVMNMGYQNTFSKQLGDLRYLPQQTFQPQAMDHIYTSQLARGPDPDQWRKIITSELSK